jgi:hypothetical protein
MALERLNGLTDIHLSLRIVLSEWLYTSRGLLKERKLANSGLSDAKS